MLSLLFDPSFLWSCTNAPSSLNEAAPSTQQEAATAVLDYRNLAAELREIAQRREMEAEVLARQPNSDLAKITHWRDMAEQLRKTPRPRSRMRQTCRKTFRTAWFSKRRC